MGSLIGTAVGLDFGTLIRLLGGWFVDGLKVTGAVVGIKVELEVDSAMGPPVAPQVG